MAPPSKNDRTTRGRIEWRGSQRQNRYRAPPQNGAFLRSPPKWRSLLELTIRLANLPAGTTTKSLWTIFSSEGELSFIEIFENKAGSRKGTGRIRFRPPPTRAFWEPDGFFSIPTGEHGGFVQIRVDLDPIERRYQIQSPLQKNIWYPEVLTVPLTSIDFGTMLDQQKMMKLHTIRRMGLERPDPYLQIDLLRSKLKIQFTCDIQAKSIDQESQVTSDEAAKTLRRTSTHQFAVPFSQLRQIYRVVIDTQHTALFITLDSPPRFFRKTNPATSHQPQGLVWSEFDSWRRETDILYEGISVAKNPVTLVEPNAMIDMGRWKTYRLLIDTKIVEGDILQNMENSLSDFNIQITSADIDIVKRKDPLLWSILDDPQKTASKDQLGPLMDDSRSVLPFQVRYQLEVCISQGILCDYEISKDFIQALVALSDVDVQKATNLLEYFSERQKRVYHPITIFNDTEALEFQPRSKIPHYCASTRKATITPTAVLFTTPTVETSNRVIRQFSKFGDRFLRVQFTDEKAEGRINACDKVQNDELFIRIYRTLSNGIKIGDRHYEFLAFGNSQFRENGAYLFCPTPELSCSDIRHWMGDFTHIPVVAKYAARLGQCFSTTRAIHNVKVELVPIPDIERNNFCFTDGVGKISSLNAHMIAKELGLPDFTSAPSAFQFRLGGCKGILAVSPDAKGRQVHIRKSQSKFRAVYNGLEIIRCSRYSVATLNRQTITILSSLGVDDAIFLKLLSEQLEDYNKAMSDHSVALNVLERYTDDSRMTVVISGMLRRGFINSEEPFVSSLLHLWRTWSIKLLKEKARITVEQGAFLLGCVDETGTLRGHSDSTLNDESPQIDTLPQIFIQVPSKRQHDQYTVITGICILGRNPSLHPGDIRVVQAVDVPALHHLRDVVVFPQLGDRDVPSMCSGGDLDGDDFFVIWDPNLIPQQWNNAPMDYMAANPRKLDRPVAVSDLTKFFVRYMKNDSLPTIAHAHLAYSDWSNDTVKDYRCLELAALHSKAVDYVKTGEPAEMPRRLRPRKWPHFMEKIHKPKEQTYISNKILGKLYDKVERVDFVPQYTQPFDPRILDAYTADDELLGRVRNLKSEYDSAMKRIMAQREIGTEFEVWSTFVLSKPRVGSGYKTREEMAGISEALKDRFRKASYDIAGGKDFADIAPVAAAMYRVTWEEMEIALDECKKTITLGGREIPRRKMEPKYMPLISFPWIFVEVLGQIITGIDEKKTLEDMGVTFLPFHIDDSQEHKSSPANIDASEDFVQTADGSVTHRGEVLNLFQTDDDVGYASLDKLDRTARSSEDVTSPRDDGQILSPVSSSHPSRSISSLKSVDEIELLVDHSDSDAVQGQIDSNTVGRAREGSSLADLAFLEGCKDFSNSTSRLDQKSSPTKVSKKVGDLVVLGNDGTPEGDDTSEYNDTPEDDTPPEDSNTFEDDSSPGDDNNTGNDTTPGDDAMHGDNESDVVIEELVTLDETGELSALERLEKLLSLI